MHILLQNIYDSFVHGGRPEVRQCISEDGEVWCNYINTTRACTDRGLSLDKRMRRGLHGVSAEFRFFGSRFLHLMATGTVPRPVRFAARLETCL